MKRSLYFFIACVLVVLLSLPVLAGSERLKSPRVVYSEPNDEAIVDLTGKPGLVFKWKSQPIPGGGRVGYRFKLIKGFGYDTVASEKLGRDVFSIEVPADKFEDGATYTWSVEQRDASSMLWSLSTAWSFKVKKK